MKAPCRNIVLLHGVNNVPEIWTPLAEHFEDSGFEVLAPQLPALKSIESIADHLLPLLPDEFIGLGHSFGAMVMAGLVARSPARVKAAVFIASRISEDPKKVRDRKLASGHFRALTNEEFAQRIGTDVFHPAYRNDRALVDQRIRHLEQYGPCSFADHQMAMARRGSLVPHLADFTGPKLWVIPDADSVISPEVQSDLAEQIGADSIVVEDTGHMVIAERPLHVATGVTNWLGQIE